MLEALIIRTMANQIHNNNRHDKMVCGIKKIKYLHARTQYINPLTAKCILIFICKNQN